MELGTWNLEPGTWKKTDLDRLLKSLYPPAPAIGPRKTMGIAALIVGSGMSEINLAAGARRLVMGWVCLFQFAPILAGELAGLRPATFQGVTPGVTSLKMIRAKFTSGLSMKGATCWELDVGAPFRSVELYINSAKVLTHIHATLITPRPLDVAESELGLGNSEPIEMRDGDRKRYFYYPERGLRLYLADVPNRHVQAIGLYQLNSSDLLRVRGEADPLEFYQAMYSREHLDDPGKLRLLEWYLRGGHVGEASDLIDDVSTTTEFHRGLLRARKNLWTGDVVAISELGKHTASKKPLVAASRKIALARVCAFPQVGELKRASDLVGDAMKTLTPQLQTKHVIEARRLLLEAHVVMVQVIASGTWDKKQQRLEEWLANTESLLDVVDNPSGAPLSRLQSIRRVLDALANVEFEVPHQRWEMLAQSAERQTTLSTPFAMSELALESARIQRQLARMARNRGEVDEALQRAMLSQKRLNDVQHEFWNRRKEIETKETQFLLGALHAMGKEDHVAAVRWFETVEHTVDQIDPESHSPGTVGDRLVSMGVSYWAIGKRDKALELTEQGRQRLDSLVQAGRLPEASLATAFQNLSVMHGNLGNDEKSAKFTELARNLTEGRR